jgi:hypothetical protein
MKTDVQVLDGLLDLTLHFESASNRLSDYVFNMSILKMRLWMLNEMEPCHSGLNRKNKATKLKQKHDNTLKENLYYLQICV